MHANDWYIYGSIIIFVVGFAIYSALKAKKEDRKDTFFGCVGCAGVLFLVFGNIIVVLTSSIKWDGRHEETKSEYPNIKYKEVFYIKDGEKDGEYISNYLNGSKKQRGYYENGKQVGTWTEWYTNGQKKRETNYSVYNPYRLEVEWHENGQVAGKYYYNREGLWDSWDSHHLTETYYENGQQASEGDPEYNTGRTWYENGQINVEVVRKDGVLMKYQRFNQDGSPCEYTYYKNGDGIVADQYSWDDDVPHTLLLYKDYKLVRRIGDN
jgi:antitoxin component YwqK of YwqJK toxin-antitoxin module